MLAALSLGCSHGLIVAIFVLTASACESAVALSLIVSQFLASHDTTVGLLRSLKHPPVAFHLLLFSESATLCVALTVDCAVGSLLLFVSLGASRGQQIAAAVKRRSFECGFSHFNDTRQSFNVNFYLVSILFVLFDIEITLLVPWALVASASPASSF